MTLLAMPMARNESEEEEEEDDPMISTYHKLLLFPSQIHKLSTIIALMAHERDLVGRLQQAQEEAAGPPLSNSFDWCSQLHYSMDNEIRAVNIKVNPLPTPSTNQFASPFTLQNPLQYYLVYPTYNSY